MRESGYEYRDDLTETFSICYRWLLPEVIQRNYCLMGALEEPSAGRWDALFLLAANNFERGLPLPSSWSGGWQLVSGEAHNYSWKSEVPGAGEEATWFQWLLIIGGSLAKQVDNVCSIFLLVSRMTVPIPDCSTVEWNIEYSVCPRKTEVKGIIS